jgi:IS4 transposase
VKFVSDGKSFDARLCALRNSQTAAERAQARVLRTARKKKTQLRPETLEFAQYVFVLTTVNAAQLSTEQVLELYRARWQIELCFKRMKSLMQMGHVPKRSDLSARAWIQAKLLTVLIIERLLRQAQLFSPWGYPIDLSQPVARVS